MIFNYEITVRSGEKFCIFVPSTLDIDLKAEWIHGMQYRFTVEKYNKYPAMNKYILCSIRTSEIVCAKLVKVEDRIIDMSKIKEVHKI